MTTWYFSESEGVDAFGYGLAPETPFKTLLYSYIAQSEGDTLRFKAGDTWREKFVTKSDNVTCEPYGKGDNPVFSGGEIKTGWTFFDNEYPGWWYQISVDCGVITEDGEPLTFLEWDTDFFVTIEGAKPGSYTFWPGANVLYVYCSDGGDPNTKTIEAAERDYAVQIVNDDFYITDIDTKLASFHNVLAENVSNTSIKSMNCSLAGGIFVPVLGLYFGNGIQFGDGCTNPTAENITFDHIFDTAITAQTYRDNAKISGATFKNITAYRAGYAALEIAVTGTTANSTIKNVNVNGFTSYAAGYGFSGVRYGNKGSGVHIETPENSIDSYIENTKLKNITIKGSAGDGMFCFERTGRVSLTDSEVINNKVGIVSGALSTVNNGGLFMAKNNVNLNIEQGLLYNNSSGLGACLKRNNISCNGGNNVEFINRNRLADNTDSRNKFSSSGAGLAFSSLENAGEVYQDGNLYHRKSGDIVSRFNVLYGSGNQAAFRGDSGDNSARLLTGSPPRLKT